MAETSSTNQLDMITLGQAILAAHQRSDERMEAVIKELRDQPKLYMDARGADIRYHELSRRLEVLEMGHLDVKQYEQRHQELERRVSVIEAGLEKIKQQLAGLPDQLWQRIEGRSDSSRGHLIAIGVAVFNGSIAVVIGLLGFFHHL